MMGFDNPFYHQESRWRISHVLGYHGPLQIATFGELRSCTIYFHHSVIIPSLSLNNQHKNLPYQGTRRKGPLDPSRLLGWWLHQLNTLRQLLMVIRNPGGWPMYIYILYIYIYHMYTYIIDIHVYTVYIYMYMCANISMVVYLEKRDVYHYMYVIT